MTIKLEIRCYLQYGDNKRKVKHFDKNIEVHEATQALDVLEKAAQEKLSKVFAYVTEVRAKSVTSDGNPTSLDSDDLVMRFRPYVLALDNKMPWLKALNEHDTAGLERLRAEYAQDTSGDAAQDPNAGPVKNWMAVQCIPYVVSVSTEAINSGTRCEDFVELKAHYKTAFKVHNECLVSIEKCAQVLAKAVAKSTEAKGKAKPKGKASQKTLTQELPAPVVASKATAPEILVQQLPKQNSITRISDVAQFRSEEVSPPAVGGYGWGGVPPQKNQGVDKFISFSQIAF